MVKVIFHTLRNLWEQILSFERGSHFEKGRDCRESLLDTVESFDMRSGCANLLTCSHAFSIRVENSVDVVRSQLIWVNNDFQKR